MTLTEQTIKVEELLGTVVEALDSLQDASDDRRMNPVFDDALEFAQWSLEVVEEYFAELSSDLRSVV